FRAPRPFRFALQPSTYHAPRITRSWHACCEKGLRWGLSPGADHKAARKGERAMPIRQHNAPKATPAHDGRASRDAGRSENQPILNQRSPETQQYGTVRNLPIGLPAGARQQNCELLNQILADTVQLY